MGKRIYSDALLKLLLRANQHMQTKDYRAALSLYEQAGEISQTPEILAQIASCHLRIAFYGDGTEPVGYEKAVEYMERVVALAPQVGFWHARLAEYLYIGLLECERSESEYRTAIELGSKNENAYRGGAMLYNVPEAHVSVEEAIEWLEAAAEISPNDPDIWGRLGQLCHEAGRECEARAHWARALLCPRPLEEGYLEDVEQAVGVSE